MSDSSTKLAPFNPTSDEAIEAGLGMAAVGNDDVVFDIGCGDGRLLIAAAKLGAKCVGVEYDATFSSRAIANAEAAGVSDRIEIICGDATALTDLRGATVVFVYLVPDGLRRMLPLLQGALSSGARIISNMFSLPGLEYAEKRVAKGLPVYLYKSVPVDSK